MLEPTFPAQISAVTSGASDRNNATVISDGSQEVAPNAASDGRDCLVNTMPVTNPVSVISGSERTPTASHCLMSSRKCMGR